MSILKKPYTISVWDDVWNAATGKFEEQRVGIIGADNMLYQGRAIEPNLVRNVNGTKKFSFKMYKYFIDNETGERVENPFIGWLVSERKVKLQYKGKWYDFIVKNINENSSNYLYAYQLEDALVQELSKNGFGVTLDAQLMNNMGTAGKLASYVLDETDWSVNSEALVEKVEDNLVYVDIPEDIGKFNIYRVKDQVIIPGEDNTSGVEEILLTEDTEVKKSDLIGKTVLAFYTSCTSKPHRFQFIYIPEGYYKEDNNGKRIPSVSTDENQIIDVKDCQYYCEINTPEAKGVYVQHSTFKQFYLPKDFKTIDFGEDGISNNHDTTISVWYRGHRYGFAQDAKYIPALNRYCNIYKKNGETYYGYVDNDYNSPALLQNVITNTDFKGTTGWVGTYSGNASNAKSTYGATIEPVYGEFDNSNKFSSVVDQLSNGTYDSTNNYKSYLKVTFPTADDNNQGILINTGFYDNRTLIGEVDYDEEWCFEPIILASNGQKIELPYAIFDFKLQEVSFDPETGAYNLGKIWAKVLEGSNRLKFNPAPPKDENGDTIESTTYANVKVPKKEFKKKEIKLVITPKNKGKQTYYIEGMQLFKLVLNDQAEIIKPGVLETEGVIKTTYRFFSALEVEDNEGNVKQEPIDVEAIKYENFDKTEIDYSVYVPQYNEGAQKVRSVDAKESNYFNILQSIAEKFEAWLELEIGRSDQGGITSKTVKFKNYAGKDNYASFRYGVNLKDIQRTYESKNIVTKLIVKQNSNEHAENGFCTIARAGANQTGENYIYDFRYYHDRDMLDKIEYVAGLYYPENIYHEGLVEAGPDITGTPCAAPGEHGQEGHNCYNLQNYFNRVKNLNVKIQDINDIIIPKQNELVKLKAELAVQEGLRNAAAEGLEEVREDFQALTGATPETISDSDADVNSSNIQSMLAEYATYMAQYNNAKVLAGYITEDNTEAKGSLQIDVEAKETEIKQAQTEVETLIGYKKELNKLFYSRYSRFIQEGTWIDEKYIDDNKYYADAQSVMYHSCYPQVAYTINVIALSALPGYEYFDFELGDRTYAIDPEFFGEDRQEAVIINELSENLDDPSRDQIKVQNFKNQFQDLFQKITATVQQAQYSSGSYEKAVALAEANAAIKSEFLQDALIAGMDKLSVAGQTTVEQGTNGITLTDSSTQDQMRLIGGAILMSTQDENGQRKWKTGLTPEGISASLVTAGTVDTGKIQIKNGKDVTFLWNSLGISAFDVDWKNGEVVGTPDTSQFVRFDKHGIYGMNIGDETMKDGMSWAPTDSKSIDEDATFALTWKGLKVTNKNNYSLRIGDGAKMDDGDTDLLKITDKAGATTFAIKEDGTVLWGAGSTATKAQYSVDGKGDWHGTKAPEDYFVRYSYDGGNTWGDAIQIQGRDGVGTQGASLEVQYQYAESFDEAVLGNWSGTYPETEQGETLWMRQRLSDTDIWSNPIQISARDGKPGQDGSDIEYIYYQSAEKITDWNNKGPDTNGGFTYTSVLRNEWKSSPQGVSETYLYEYMTYAKKQVGATDFDNFNSEPVIWSKWGEKGQDGDGVTYYYCQMTTEEKPVYPTPTDKKYQWTNDPQGVDEEHPFEYVATKATSAIEIYAKKANVGPRTYARAAWEDYGAIGKRNSWTIQATGVNNSHINVGDYAYIESITNDDERTLVRLYGEVVALNNPNEYQGSIDLISKRLVFGEDTYKVSLWTKWSKDGEDGEDGESAYYIYHDKYDGNGMPNLPTKFGSDNNEVETDYWSIPINKREYKEDPSTKDEYDYGGWYRTQTGDSVYQAWKVCKSSEQAGIAWGPVKRIDGTLTNYNDLWNALDEKSSEDNSYGGIYTIEDGEDKYIGIKADFIKTGALCVGDNPYYLEGENEGQLNPAASNKFYADLSEDGAVRIAGWEVTGAGLEKNVENDEGEEDNTYVGMYSGSDEKMAWPSLVTSGGTSYVRFYAGLKKNDDGSISECNFAVLEDGSVYLQKAQVGGNSSLQLEEDKEPVEIASIFTTMSETQSLVEEFNEELSQNTVSELQSSVKGLANNYTSIQETLLINLKPKSVETQSVGNNIYAGELQFKENV